jgi:hypothetical protein
MHEDVLNPLSVMKGYAADQIMVVPIIAMITAFQMSRNTHASNTLINSPRDGDTNTMLHVLALVPTSILTAPKVKYPERNKKI